MRRQHPTEAASQEALISFCTMLEPRVPALRWLFHVPNGGWRHKAVAVQMQRHGVKPGVPDLLLPVASGRFHGFACELKSASGRLQPTQEAWLDMLESQSWCCVVCWRWEDAARELLRYLQHNPEEYGL